MPKRSQKWTIGDLFIVPQSDGKWSLGHVIGREAEVLNSVTCAFYDRRLESESQQVQEPPGDDKLISLLFVTRDLLDTGRWKVIGNRPSLIEKSRHPYEQQRAKGFVGAKVIGSANLEAFLNAFYALHPWNSWKKPDYLDSLLISLDRKPKTLIYK